MRANGAPRAYLPVILLAVIGVLIAACSSGASSKPVPRAATPAGAWPYPNGDLANTRNAAGSAITLANVSGLRHSKRESIPQTG